MVNQVLLSQVVETALRQVQGNKRWTNAILRGAELIESNRCLPVDNGSLLILSESGHNYIVNGSCRTEAGLCPALAQHKPCKHRADFRLLQLYEEREH
jgi:hypothetical protein